MIIKTYPIKSLKKVRNKNMKILTKAIKEKLIANHKEQDGTKEFKAVLKLFNPAGIGTWYLSELDPETNIAFGLCCLTDEELGYVDLNELLTVKHHLGFGIERDKFFKPKSLEDCRRAEDLRKPNDITNAVL